MKPEKPAGENRPTAGYRSGRVPTACRDAPPRIQKRHKSKLHVADHVQRLFRLYAESVQHESGSFVSVPERQHEEALANLIYGVQSRKGFIVLTGEVGTGKTTMLECLRDFLTRSRSLSRRSSIRVSRSSSSSKCSPTISTRETVGPRPKRWLR